MFLSIYEINVLFLVMCHCRIKNKNDEKQKYCQEKGWMACIHHFSTFFFHLYRKEEDDSSLE